ncbi:MAG: AAA family ATPase, partial [Bacteroidota bacterium]
MLTQLHISNYAIINEVDIEFDKKLNIITGETGAGKSILMGALGLILGERADTKVLMNVKEKCVVEGTFNISGYRLKNYFETNELDYDNTCIIRREISANGKSRAFINDTPVNLSLLKELGTKLIDIVSQHETLELNESDFQLSIIDAIAETEDLVLEYQQAFHQYQLLVKELNALMEQEAKSRKDEDYFRFQLDELVQAAITENEQEELEKNLSVLSHAEIIQQSAGNASSLLDADEQSITENLRNLKSVLSPAAKHFQKIDELILRIESSLIELKDVAAELDQIAQSTQANPNELLRIENRLLIIFNLQKKHRVNNCTELLDVQQKFQLDLDAIGSLQTEIEKKEKELAAKKSLLEKQAATLSNKRN